MASCRFVCISLAFAVTISLTSASLEHNSQRNVIRRSAGISTLPHVYVWLFVYGGFSKECWVDGAFVLPFFILMNWIRFSEFWNSQIEFSWFLFLRIIIDESIHMCVYACIYNGMCQSFHFSSSNAKWSHIVFCTPFVSAHLHFTNSIRLFIFACFVPLGCEFAFATSLTKSHKYFLCHKPKTQCCVNFPLAGVC